MAPAPIRQLDEATANQIAAGEVVERPASVVKELLENAVDADARRITVEVEEGGLRLIRVTDDGHGMAPEDARLSFARHATSKIRSFDDLLDVRTMGFRGEAIPSIASVSRFTMTTRTADALEGTRLVVEGGGAPLQSEVGVAPGTCIEVADLFFNVPARRKFLKRPATELGHISDAVVRVAIARTQVGFRLKHGPKVLLDVPPASAEDPRGRLGRILGTKTADALHPIEAQPPGPVAVTGWVASPELSERTTRGQFVFVNGRFVRDRTIQHAIQEGYRTLMEKGRHPVVVLHLEVPPDAYDVNVHPQKTEVRFAQTGDVHRAVTGALQRTLLGQPWLQSADYAVALARSANQGSGAAVIRDRDDKGLAALIGVPDIPLPTRPSAGWAQPQAGGASPPPYPGEASPPYPGEAPPPYPGGASPPRSASTGGSVALPSPVRPPPPTDGPVTRPAAPSARRFGQLEPIGQVLGTYLVCQGPDEMVVIDQHAAHERIAFQRMRTERKQRAVVSQPLLVPVAVELDELRAATADQHATRLMDLGFELAAFGGTTWMIKAMPAALAGANIERLVLDMLDELAQFEQTTPLEDQEEALLSCAACHSVVRAGDRLTKEEIRALLVQMDRIDFGAHCPHGRPVFVHWSGRDLARMFHRT